MTDRRSDKPQFRTLEEGGSVVAHGVRIEYVKADAGKVRLKIWREREIVDLKPLPVDIPDEFAID